MSIHSTIGYLYRIWSRWFYCPIHRRLSKTCRFQYKNKNLYPSLLTVVYIYIYILYTASDTRRIQLHENKFHLTGRLQEFNYFICGNEWWNLFTAVNCRRVFFLHQFGSIETH